MSRDETCRWWTETPLSDDVGNEVVFNESDSVFQLQLALLQPCDLQLVDEAAFAGFTERVDSHVEVAVLALQRFQSLAKFLLVHVRPLRISSRRMAFP